MSAPDPASSASSGGDAVIVARALTKRFDDFVAVDDIDVEVQRGEAFGFLGPNGAGKTSTMRMIGCVSPVTSGELRVLGLHPERDGATIRSRLGVVPQEDALDTELTVRENLVLYGRYFGIARSVLRPRVAELLEFMQLTERADERVEPLSGGMKRRLSIARGLVNEPELVLLDEPTTGLDPQARQMVWERLHELKSRGVSLVLTTHYMEEAEQLCDRLVVMDQAVVVAEGSPAELIAAHVTPEVVELKFALDDVRRAALAVIDGTAERVEELSQRVLVYTHDGESVVGALHGAGVHPASVLIRRSTLEDVFLSLTGRTLED